MSTEQMDFATALKSGMATRQNDSPDPAPAGGGEDFAAQAAAQAAADAAAAQAAADAAAAQAAAGGTAAASPAFDFSRFGVKDEEELTARIRRAEELETQLKDVTEKVKPVLEFGQYIPHVQNPFVNETVHKVNHFMQKTGIHDLNIATQVLGTTDDQLKSDPIKAIVMADVVSNPQMAQVGIDKLYRAAAREAGVDPATPYSEWPDDVKETLEVRAAKALITIGEKRKEWETPTDFFANLQQQRQETETRTRQAAEAWEKELPVLFSGMNKIAREVEVEGVGKVTSEVALSAEEVNSIVTSLKPNLARLPLNDAGKQQAKALVENELRSAMLDKLIAAAVKNYDSGVRANVEQEIRKGITNPGLPGGSSKPAQPPAAGSSPFGDYVKAKAGATKRPD